MRRCNSCATQSRCPIYAEVGEVNGCSYFWPLDGSRPKDDKGYLRSLKQTAKEIKAKKRAGQWDDKAKEPL